MRFNIAKQSHSIANAYVGSSAFEKLKPKYYIETCWQKEVKYKNRTDILEGKVSIYAGS